MLIGKFLRFQCDFCQQLFGKEGYGLPDGMKYIPIKMLEGGGVKHICASCIAAEKHGPAKLKNSGER